MGISTAFQCDFGGFRGFSRHFRSASRAFKRSFRNLLKVFKEFQVHFKWITEISRTFNWHYGYLRGVQGISGPFHGVSRDFLERSQEYMGAHKPCSQILIISDPLVKLEFCAYKNLKFGRSWLWSDPPSHLNVYVIYPWEVRGIPKGLRVFQEPY